MSSPTVPQVLVKDFPDPRARAVQQHPLISVADPQRFAHLIRSPALDVTQGDHHPLAVWQLLDRRCDRRASLRREQRVFGPLARIGHPEIRARPMVTRKETRRLDAWF